MNATEIINYINRKENLYIPIDRARKFGRTISDLKFPKKIIQGKTVYEVAENKIENINGINY